MRATTPKLLTLVFITVTLFPITVHAQEMPAPSLPEQTDVRIIVDISGSMKDNDPENLRQPAVRLLARMVPEGTTAGLWTFGQYVNMLVPHRVVGDGWREQAIEQSRQINSVALRTNLGKAIEVASDGYYTGGVLENTHFILLTDGKVDISDEGAINRQEETRILNTLVADLAEQGATFHPIALSSQADAEFLQKLALESGGRFQVADTAEALNRAFLQALNTAIPQEQIPIVGNGFSVDEGVTEYTALVFWGERETRETRQLELVRPDGRTINLQELPENIRWAREAGYDLMTVSEPMAGEWRINGELGEGSRVTVVSDLRMAVSPVPPTFSGAEPINLEIAFFEDEERITDPDFLQVLDVRLSITSEDGRSGTKVLSGNKPPENGVFSDTIGQLPTGGVYRLEIIADGQTFGRKFSTQTSFVAPEGLPGDAKLDAEPQEASEVAETSSDSSPGLEQPAGEDSTEPQPEASSEPAITSPIDVSEVEAPETAADQSPGPEDDAVSALPIPVWAVGAGVGGLGLMALIWLSMKKRQAQRSEQARAAAERETVADLDEESEPEASVTESPAEQPVEEASENIPEVTEETQAVAEETELEATPEESDDEEEFGLDDFDLSEFDDLPEYDESGSEQESDDPKPTPKDSDQKK